ncbi:TPA: DUF4430 domain-containing protein [Enterococcus faecium]|uniref:Transcobalamin-like C-terminal domain-containing protein n=5 Tax=Enterococcus TaxID=1350 RepID=A0A367CBA2_9ENTE|nr:MULTISPECIES: DUF4430 domain-containing protein [Enterococcus]MBR9930114.1 DUF4430 domain-containing protein [Enterococcus sp. 079]HAQ1361792.1 DUF4430 domain-containing protein [Enterococcus faecium Ef_aus0098]AGE31355.1 Additional lipoprotein component of predicted cobalamin ECF transporter [Enterococcus faecium ATCC 8459 = NRRL B-2354]AZQ19010.1 DUF4430 domain-containing protein [Enterococcus faecium]EEI61698.1 hypothetical protein HMPREF0352_0101 [Enterococcus faecium TX1330]
MKKLATLLTVFIGLFIMTGCQSNQNDQASSKASTQATSEVAKSSALIKLTDSDKEITSKTVTYKSGESLLVILKANFEVKERDGFITSIDGHAQDESQNKYWTFTINGKMGEKGAGETTLDNDDQVVFNLGVFK